MAVDLEYRQFSYFTNHSSTKYEPKKKNRFVLYLEEIPSAPWGALEFKTQTLTYTDPSHHTNNLLISLTNFSRPTYSVEAFGIPNYNDTIYIPGKPSQSREINCTFNDFIGSNSTELLDSTSAILYRWYNLVHNLDIGSVGYKSRFAINASLYLLAPTGKQIEHWKYFRIWPKSIVFGEVDYNSADICNIDVTFQYDKAKFISGKAKPDLVPDGSGSDYYINNALYENTVIDNDTVEESDDELIDFTIDNKKTYRNLNITGDVETAKKDIYTPKTTGKDSEIKAESDFTVEDDVKTYNVNESGKDSDPTVSFEVEKDTNEKIYGDTTTGIKPIISGKNEGEDGGIKAESDFTITTNENNVILSKTYNVNESGKGVFKGAEDNRTYTESYPYIDDNGNKNFKNVTIDLTQKSGEKNQSGTNEPIKAESDFIIENDNKIYNVNEAREIIPPTTSFKLNSSTNERTYDEETTGIKPIISGKNEGEDGGIKAESDFTIENDNKIYNVNESGKNETIENESDFTIDSRGRKKYKSNTIFNTFFPKKDISGE